ncbi:MAG: FMN-binding negative transcriptional regulator [Candidatus Eremiobacteraeota bacterium]|nr:FMN-binding negative transcriptional regulator [Candidatus Eremiobacteraeota bacterium]
MYVPKPFEEFDVTRLHALMDEYRFATLVTSGAAGLQATHLPLLLDAAGEFGTLYGHVARANPQWRAFAEGSTLAIFAGPHAYVSPRWYHDAANVPTWDYAVVHAHGKPRLIEEPREVERFLDRLVDREERDASTPWRVSQAPREYIERLTGAIVAFSLPIERLQGAFKLSQNHDATDRAMVREALQQSAAAPSRRIAELIPQG